MNCKMKYKLGISIVMLLISIVAIIYGIIIDTDASSFITGFGSGLGGTSLVLLFKAISTSKDPIRAKKIEIQENDERNIKIATTSYALSFRVCLLLEVLAMIILVFLKEKDIAFILSIIMLIEMFIFLIIYVIQSKKN